MNLDEFTVRVEAALLIKRRLRRTSADDRIRALAEDCADAAGGDDECVSRERSHFHAAQIHGANAAAHAVAIKHGRQKFPMLVFSDLAVSLVATYLLIERIKQLLACGCAGEGGAIEQCSAKAAKVEQAFGRPVERHAHAIQQIDDSGRSLAHGLDWRLVGEKIAPIN